MITHEYDGGVLYGCDVCGLARDHQIHAAAPFESDFDPGCKP